MPITGTTTTIASYNSVKKPLSALVAKRLTHDMIVSWRDCIRFNIIPSTFPLPPSTVNINSTQEEAEAIKLATYSKLGIHRKPTTH